MIPVHFNALYPFHALHLHMEISNLLKINDILHYTYIRVHESHPALD